MQVRVLRFQFMPYNPYAYVTNHVNITVSKKCLKSKIIFTQKTIRLVKALQRVGFIKNYVIVNNNNNKFIIFTIFFYKNTSYFHNVRLISTPSKKIYITLNALRKLKYATRNSIFLISTSKGIITHNEAISNKIGGLLLCAIH